MSGRDMATIETAWRDLRAALDGEVVLPGSPRYDEVRRPQIPRFHDVRPQAVVLCRTAEDVVEAIAFARRSGIEVAVRSGGHDFAGRSSGPGMVLDLTPMRSLEVSDGLATVGPGSRLGDLYGALARHGVTIPAGCGATVGIGGQALGGGLGLLGRSRGLTSDQLVAAKVVLADGRVVECDEQSPRGPVLGAARRGRPGPRRGHEPHAPHAARAGGHLVPPQVALRARGGADRRLAGVVADGARPTRGEPARHRRRRGRRRPGGPPVRLAARQRDRDRRAARRVRVGCRRATPPPRRARTCATAS